ncbi:MAG TPA: hypothetical protein VN033_13315 [Vulgatibacter sp.]|nr:hypothetical protein [Vulgatibacter sp.]
MSREPTHPHIRLEEDVVNTRLLMTLVILTVLITLGGIGWAWLEFDRETTRLGGLPHPVPPPTAPREISGVNQTLIRFERHGQVLEQRQRRALEEFGWVDPARGIVRIPIDEAIRLKAEELSP